ncbi:MAG: O-antigen ligase family protein, partial [Planctomycetota bacterium]
MITWAAATYGAVEPWSEMPLVIAATALGVLSCIRFCREGGQWPCLAPLALVAGFAAYAALQAAPIFKHAVLGPGAAKDDTLVRSAISYYPAATAHGVRMVLVGMAVFFAAGCRASGRSNLKRLLLALFLVGFVQAGIALAQAAGLVGFPGWDSGGVGNAAAGTFINRSNFCQFVNLGIAAGLGLLLIRLSEDRQVRRPYRSGAEATVLLERHGWLLAGIALQALSVACSLSRNGLFAMLVASVIVAALVGRERTLGWRAWLLGAAPIACLVGVLLFGFERIYQRVGQLDDQAYLGERWEMATATLRLASDHLPTGVGLDAFGMVFSAYDTTNVAAKAEQADCDYAQLLAETGVPGVLLIVAFLAAVIWRIRHVLTTSTSPSRHALYGVVFGLVAVGVQSTTDYGQRLPAVFMMTATLCGLCWAIPAGKQHGRAKSDRTRKTLPAAVGIAICFVAASTWSVVQTARDYQAYHWWAIASELQQQAIDSGEPLKPEERADQVAAAEAAAAIRPGNAEYRYWTSGFRWELVLASGLDEATVVADPNGRAIALQIADELAETRRSFPTYGPAWVLEARLRLLAGDPDGVRLARRGAELARDNADALLQAAWVEATSEDGNPEAAAELLRRVIALGGVDFTAIAELCVAGLNRPSLAAQLADQE